MGYKLILLFTIVVLFSSVTNMKHRKKLQNRQLVGFAAENNSPSSCECGVMNDPNVKPLVAGGRDVGSPYKYPWMVSLQKEEDEWEHSCGGTLVSNSFVLTAAHCLLSFKIKDVLDPDQKKCTVFPSGAVIDCFKDSMSFKIGVREKNSSVSRLFCVRGYFLHPKYNITTIKYDMALVQLKKPITCSWSLRPICLPLKVPVPKAGTELIATGWGHTGGEKGEKVQPSSVLLEARLKIQSKDVCEKTKDMILENTLMESHLCGYGETQGMCKADSGGPLFGSVNKKFYIFGVFTFYLVKPEDKAEGKIKNCDLQYPNFFSDVKRSLDWIHQTMRNKSR